MDRNDVVTLLWDIENFSYIDVFSQKLESAVFLSKSLDRTKWKIGCEMSCDDGTEDYYYFYLTRCPSDADQNEVDMIVLDCELSIIEENGTSLVSELVTKHDFKKIHNWSTGREFVLKNDVLIDKRVKFMPYNTLHVRCQMSRSCNKITLPELLNVQTKMERNIFFWNIKKFSNRKTDEVIDVLVKKKVGQTLVLSYKCYKDEKRDKVIFEITSNKSDASIDLYCELWALDCTGKGFCKVVDDFPLPNENPYQLSFSRDLSNLLLNKELYLPMDVLSLRVDTFFWCNDNAENYSSPIQNVQVCENNFQISLDKFVKDMRCLYKEGLLSDFTLCAGNKSFPVHKSILSVRSPVFKAMFSNPMAEKDGHVLEIPDVDPGTLEKMLLFIYLNEMQDLESDSALNLYFAADKYGIEDLKGITRSILKSTLCVSNVLDIIVHADSRGDQDLKSSAMEFIISHDEQIIESEYWRNFQKEQIHLTIEIFSALYTNMKKIVRLI